MSQQKFTRTSPSPRYRRLIEQYQQMHLHGTVEPYELIHAPSVSHGHH